MASGDNYTVLLPRKDDWHHLREVIRKLWQQVGYLEGRLGPITLRDSVTVLGTVTSQAPEPTVVFIEVDPYTVESDAITNVFVDNGPSAGDISIYLPTPATDGKKIWVKKTDAGADSVFVLGQLNAQIDGGASVGLTAADPQRGFVGDGTDWWTFTA